MFRAFAILQFAVVFMLWCSGRVRHEQAGALINEEKLLDCKRKNLRKGGERLRHPNHSCFEPRPRGLEIECLIEAFVDLLDELAHGFGHGAAHGLADYRIKRLDHFIFGFGDLLFDGRPHQRRNDFRHFRAGTGDFPFQQICHDRVERGQ